MQTVIETQNLQIGFGNFVLMKDVSFSVHKGEIFFIMGGSGCGKSTLLRALMGLLTPQNGKVYINNSNIWEQNEEERKKLLSKTGVLFQGGALFSSMTLLENVSLPLQHYTNLNEEEIKANARLKLALTGLAGFEDYYPSQISGGMKKRAGLARALALDPNILFLDEPSAGLDPISSKLLDDLILQLRDALNTSFVIVSHELASIFSIADNCLFLNNIVRKVTAIGNPNKLIKDKNTEQQALNFLTRGEIMHKDVA